MFDIDELIDRLEAVEKERDWHAERCEDAMNECDALRAKIEQMEIGKREISEAHNAVTRRLSVLADENTALRAKIEEMKKRLEEN